VVFDETEFPEFVHEEIHARPRGADNFGQSLLRNHRQFVVRLMLHSSVPAEHKQRSGEPLLGRIEELIDQILLDSVFVTEDIADKRVR
jgi:hypothetical protein